LSAADGNCVEIDAADLCGERRLEESAQFRGAELVRVALGSRDARTRAARLLWLLAAALAGAMIALACRALITGPRARAPQFAIQAA
jgi:hypothetical protein